MVSAVDNGLLGDLGLAVPQAAPEKELGQEDFMHLMLTQLRNQDPFKPMESGEFLGQLAQFGTVSGLAELQSSFDTLATSLVSNQALQASSLVGRTALVAASARGIASGETAGGAVDVSQATSALTVTIRDATGQPVRTLELGAQPSGLTAFTWDGLTEEGEPAPAGRYSFSAGYRSGEDEVAADMLLRAPIDSVLLGSDRFSVELRGIGELPFSAVREIRNEQAAATAASDATTD